MKAKHFWKRLAEAQEAQEIVNKFFVDVDRHFSEIGAQEIGFTYCAGDGFLLTDGRNRGDNYAISVEAVEKLFSLNSADEVFSFISSLRDSV